MVEFRSLCSRVRLHRAVVLGATALISNCSDYESCEATLSCPSAGIDSGTGGALGAAGSSPHGSAGTAGSAGSVGNAGSSGATGAAGTASGTGSAWTASDAGDSADAGSSDAGGDVPDVQPDTTDPMVLSVTPANGAGGIAKDANIVLVFSERMDPTKTLAAYSSTDLSAANVAFTWSADGTTLTIDPRTDLTYASDSVPAAAAAKNYAFTIAATAADVAGNALATPFTSRFSTLRRVTHLLNAHSQVIRKETAGTTVAPCDANMIVGALAGAWVGGLVDFDLSVLPPDLRSFESAKLEVRQHPGSGEPYGSAKLGEVVCDHTVFNPSSGATLDGAAVRRVGTLAVAPNDGPKLLEVVSAVREDYQQRAARLSRSQFRIAFTQQNPDYRASLTYAIFDCSPATPTLALTYLVP
jgi:hypothetical protein